MKPGDLHGGQNATHDQRRRDQILRIGRRQIRAPLAGDDDGGRDDAGEHGEGVLEAEEQSEEQGHAVVEAEEGGGAQGFAREGQVGFEEEGVVVGADEPFSGGLSVWG